MDSSPPRILVIDPHPVTRDGIVAVLIQALVGTVIIGAGTFPEAITLLANHLIDLVVTDFRVQGETALPFLKHLATFHPETRCLILSASDELQVGYPCVRAGACGFVAKSSPVATVADAARTVLASRHYCSERLSNALMENHRADCEATAGTHLTSRELQIFSFIGQGMPVSAIAVQLGLSVRTVEAHRDHIKNKLGHQSASQVTAAAVRWLDDNSVNI